MRNDREIVLAIEMEYKNKQMRAQIEQEKRKKQIYQLYPKLEKIDNSISEHYLNILKNSVVDDTKDKTRLEREIANLEQIRKKYIIENNIDISKMDRHYECSICKDTGVVNNGMKSERCQCFMNRYNSMVYENTNMLSLIKDANFEKFDINIFDDNIKYGNMTSREFMGKIKNKSLDFVDKFDVPSTKSMIFYGDTGLGKTFLCLCIAQRLIEKRKNVVYDSAIAMFDKLSQREFSYDKVKSDYAMYHSLVFGCDLLIIDDLGTEMTNSFTIQKLFEIVNQRIINGKKVIISTNLDVASLQERYEQRIISRFASDYNIYNFVGRDIRMFKK